MQTIGPTPIPVRMLLGLKGIGPGFAGALWFDGLFQNFQNRRQVAAYAGLAPKPWRSGTIIHEQGVLKAGNSRLVPCVATILLGLVGSLGVIRRHHRSVWNVLANAIAPEALASAALALTLWVGSIAVCVGVAVQIWHDRRNNPRF